MTFHDLPWQVPDDLQSPSPEQQQAAIKKRAFTMMGIGTLIVIVFSDPMVDVLSNVGASNLPPISRQSPVNLPS